MKVESNPIVINLWAPFTFHDVIVANLDIGQFGFHGEAYLISVDS